MEKEIKTKDRDKKIDENTKKVIRPKKNAFTVITVRNQSLIVCLKKDWIPFSPTLPVKLWAPQGLFKEP